jgi:hypothetical protein
MQRLSEEKELFFEQGFVIFNINDDALIDRINADVEQILQSKDFRTNSRVYSYNKYPRIVESYKHSQNCKDLATHFAVADRLRYFYGSVPLAFSTINFVHSTQQPLHSDYVHFGTIPHRMLVGSWVALEDIDPRSGPLQILPRSHLFELFDYSMISSGRPKSLREVKINYTLYENFIKSKIVKEGLSPVIPEMKKGDCLIWEANLLHGSPDCIDPTLTRKSQVTHWTFDNVSKHYNPSFSNIITNQLLERDISII